MSLGVPCPLAPLIEAYTQHCRRARGLRDRTLHGYGSLARLFLRAVLGADPIDPTRIRVSVDLAAPPPSPRMMGNQNVALPQRSSPS